MDDQTRQGQNHVDATSTGVAFTGEDVSSEDASGEVLYARAREIPHRRNPSFATDGEYLRLLGEAAVQGCSQAMAKLGEYAMRRCAWVEAYYWMKLAQSWGMKGASVPLREIRQCWAAMGYPNETSNVYELFGREAGSIGRALLNIDSGHDAYAAREYLKANHPEFL